VHHAKYYDFAVISAWRRELSVKIV